MGKLDNNFSRNHAYDKCELYAYVTDKHKGIDLQRTSNKAMDLGTAIHTLLENLHDVGKPMRDYNSLDGVYASILNDNADNFDVVSAALSIVQQYIRWLDRITKEKHYYADLIVLAKEYRFSQDGMSGVFDVVVFNPDDSKIWVIDYKSTKSQVGSFPRAMLGMEQFILYHEMANRIHFGTDFVGHKIGGVIAVVLKTKPVTPTVQLTKTNKISTAKAQHTSYEVFSGYLIEKYIPFHKYQDYLDWLLEDGASNGVYEISYTEYERQYVFNKFTDNNERIQSLNNIHDCAMSRTYTCASKCRIYEQCLDIGAGRTVSFEQVPQHTGKVRCVFTPKSKEK